MIIDYIHNFSKFITVRPRCMLHCVLEKPSNVTLVDKNMNATSDIF